VDVLCYIKLEPYIFRKEKGNKEESMQIDDRMKLYEKIETSRCLIPTLPIMARMDGRAFHTFTSDMPRPYSEGFMRLMQATTQWLIEETNAVCGYCQSDEITLTWYSPDIESQIFFNGKLHKMVSQLAALTTVYFNDRLSDFLDIKYKKRLPTFDARVWNVPTLEEGVNAFVWRELDATRNSLQMAAYAQFSQKQLHKKNTADMHEMLFKEKGINWNDYPDDFKRGAYFQKKIKQIPYSAEEIERLPLKHEARSNPDLIVERSVYEQIKMPPILRVENRVGVIYKGEDPIFA
jgi:tRNA(His) 5'-end guanylyltransferase